jgi:tetratricopeptide (TPR) repeat protein
VRRLALAAFAGVLALALPRSARPQAPHLEGRVVIDPPNGLVDGSFCLSRFEPRRRLRFLLAGSLNVKQVTDGQGKVLDYTGDFNGRMVGEANEYALVERDSSPPAAGLCVSYRGAVPVFDSNTATQDWKGRIVATHGAIRLSEQTRWYPTLFDSAAGRDAQAVSYQVLVSCRTCSAIYLNGSPPVTDTIGRFESTTPRTLLLMAGTFPVQSTGALSFVGGPAGAPAVRVFAASVRAIADYYAELLGQPYRERPVFLTFHSISRDRRPGRPDWAFVTWPTIAFSGGVAFDSLLVLRGGDLRLPADLWTTLSHEMGHYYFGTLKKPTGPLRWLALESTAEYLAFKSIARFEGRTAFSARVVDHLSQIAREFVPLDRINDPEQIDANYRYRFAPLFLLALERRAGEARVLGFLRALLAAPGDEPVDFAALTRAAGEAGIPPSELTTGATTADLRRALLPNVTADLAAAVADVREHDAAVNLAVAMSNADTSLEARSAVLSALRRLVALSPEHLRAHYQIGRLGALTGRDLDAALASLRRYLREPSPTGAPSHASAHWRTGMIEERRGQVERARRAYRAALALDSTHAAARDALSRLDR